MEIDDENYPKTSSEPIRSNYYIPTHAPFRYLNFFPDRFAVHLKPTSFFVRNQSSARTLIYHQVLSGPHKSGANPRHSDLISAELFDEH